MKVYLFTLCFCTENDLISIHTTREQAEYVMESYIEAERKIWKSTYDYEDYHSWEILEMEVLQ